MGPRIFATVLLGSFVVMSADLRAEPSVIRRAGDAECVALLADITPKNSDDLPLFPYVANSLTKIFTLLNPPAPKPGEILGNIRGSDVRDYAFQLEGISKALSPLHPDYEAMNRDARALENALGDYTFETEMLKYIEQSPTLSPLLTPRIRTLFEGRIASQSLHLSQNLNRDGWIGNLKAYKRFIGYLKRDGAIEKRKILRKYLLESIADQLRDTHVDLVSKKLDPREIENGVHKLRRELRMVSIILLSFPGMFYLDESVRVTGVKISEQAMANKFVPDESNLAKKAIGISRDGYLYIGDLIYRLGKLKADAGIQEYVAQALRDQDLGGEAAPLLKALDPKGAAKPSFDRTYAEAKEIFQTLIDSKILLQMEKQYRDTANVL